MNDSIPDDTAPNDLKDSLLEAMAEGALGGHDLGPWDKVENGYQARCRLCRMTIWITANPYTTA